MKNIELFAVVDREGRLYKNRDGRLCIYETIRAAKRVADDGDAVVTVTVHLDREPLIINRRVI